LEAALLVGSILCISKGINLINYQDGARVCVEHEKDLPRLNSVNLALIPKKLLQYFKDLIVWIDLEKEQVL